MDKENFVYRFFVNLHKCNWKNKKTPSENKCLFFKILQDNTNNSNWLRFLSTRFPLL